MSTRALARTLAAVAVTTLLGSGCTSSTRTSTTARAVDTSPTSDALDTTVGREPSGSTVGSAQPVDMSPVLEHLDADGGLDAAGAAAGFDLAFGGAADTNRDVLDGSGPLRWMQSVWNELPVAQRDAVSAVLEAARDPFMPADADATVATVAPGTAPLPTGRVHLARRPRVAEPILETTGCVRFDSGTAIDPVPDIVQPFVATYLAMDDEFQGELQRASVSKLGLCAFTSTQVSASVFGRVFGAAGDRTTVPDHCVVYFNPDKTAGLDDTQLAMRIGYAALQCFIATAQTGGTVDDFYTSANGAWYIEGAAMWATAAAATRVVGGTGKDLDEWWNTYLSSPQHALTDRLYDALGFFAQLQSADDGLWTRLDAVFASRSTPQAWAAAQATGDLRDTWASGYFRDSSRTDWNIEGPGVTDTVPEIATLTVTNETSAPPFSAPELAVGVAMVESTADLIHVTSDGILRISDGRADLTGVIDHYFCTRSGGDCTCPEGSRPLSGPPQALASPIDVGLSGGRRAATAGFAGLTIEEFCNTPAASWSFAVFQNGSVAPGLAGYTCDGLASTWHVIFGAGSPQLERTFDLAFSPSATTVHNDLVYDFPADNQSPPVHVEWRLDYTLDSAAEPPTIVVSGTQHETPEGGSEVVFPTNFGTGDGITLVNVTLPTLLAGHGYNHPFLAQAAADCG
jgi:hypothetical protein